MTFGEDALLPISALQHLRFCRRQCALIHLELAWAENRLTAEGRLMHARVHEQESESRGNVRVARGMRLRSLRLGLAGVADVVEFHKEGAGRDGQWRPLPVEYKRGRPKADASDEVQLCAQALCLEEMLGTDVPSGALFYGKPRRRHAVGFSPELRRTTALAAEELHALIASGITPSPEPGPKCRQCSLNGICLPVSVGRSARGYLAAAVTA